MRFNPFREFGFWRTWYSDWRRDRREEKFFRNPRISKRRKRLMRKRWY